MPNICIVVLIGVPGAGKTYFYKYINNYLNVENTNISYVSYDEQEKCMEKTEYKNFRSIVFEKVDNLLNKINENNPKDNEVIIIDDNMFYRSMRRCFYNLAKKYTTGFCEIFIKCNVDLAIERNSARTVDRVPTKTIQEMFEKLEPPSRDNSWEKYSCELNSENDYTEDDVKVVGDLIQDAIKCPVQEEEQSEENNVQPPSFNHIIDLELRKLVGRKIKDAILENESQLTIAALAEDLLLKKKSILDLIKSKELFLPDYQTDEELENILCEFLENEEIQTEESPAKKAKYSNGNGACHS